MGLKLLILCALVVLNQAAKLPKSQTATCARQCTESKKFGYETGKTYDYDYTSKVSTTIQGASEDKAGIDMAAKVHIEVQSKCDLVLKVSDVVLTESDPKSPNTRRNADVTGEFKKSLEQNPLMFSFQDGRVDELCPSNDEQTWALNIKRAIISAFQNSMDDFSQEQETKEMDVTGSCDVNYSLASNGWYTMTIKKTKDTLGCVDRHGYKTAMQGTPYRVPSEIQSMPLVKSTHECQQGISKTGILQSSSCEEQHVLRPFSRESSGAVTETKQTLKYITESQSRSTKVSTEKRTTLAFEHAFDNTNSANAQKEVVNKLKEFCELSRDALKVSTAKQFTELVRLMKTLDSDSMESVHKKVHSGKVCPKNTKVRKFFLDAIPMVGTKASLKMMTHLINTDEVTGAEADMWMTSLSFIQHPTKDILLELKPLLTNTKNGQAMLAVSSLVYTYCKSSSCANDIDMVNLVASLEDKIGVGCYADKNNVNNIIRALRAFGNAGFSSSITMVNSCLTRKENPTEVRLAAAQAFRRMACDANRNELMTIYSNRNEDSEIRIAAYLGLMTCPSKSILNKIQTTLESEEVNQFGGRVEGLEYFLESYFGPEGYFGKSKDVVKQSVKVISNKAMDKLNEEFGSTMEEFKGSMYLRIFGNELQYINTDDIKSLIEGQNFNILDFIINLAKEQDYSFTQSFMFLDTSLIIPTMAGFPLNISLDGSATIDLQASGKMDLRQIQSNPMTVSIDGKIRPSAALEVTSLMSVDAFVTKAGMKMVSSVNSASAVEGHLEIKGGQLFSAEWKTPDAKTEIFEAKTSFFTVHRDETREQKMITQNRQTKKLCTGDDLSHVTGLELCGEISYPNASLKADSPYFPLTGPLAAGVTLYKRDSHTSYKMEYKFGKTKSVVIANVGFNTPGSKVDREMRLGFNLNMKKHDIEMMMLSPWKKATFNGAVDTKQRQLNGKLLIDQSEYSVNAALASKKKSSKMIYTPSVEIVIPKKDNIKLDGTIEYLAGTTLDSAFTIRGVSKEPINMRLNMLNKKVIKSIKGSFTMDKKEEYSFETRMQTLVTKKSLRYSPFISVKTPAKLLMGLGGSVEIKYKKAAKVDLTVTGLTRSPMKYFVQLRDTGNAKQARYQTKMNIQSPILTTKGRSNIMIRPTSIITRTTFDYIIPRVARDKVTMNSKIVMKSTKKATSIKGNGVLTLKKMSHLNLNLGMNFLTNAKLTTSNFNVKYGSNKKDMNKQISFSSTVKHTLAWRASDVRVSAQLQHPESLNRSPRDFKVGAQIGKSYILAFTSQYKPKTLIKMSGDVKVNSRRVTAEIEAMNNNPQYTGAFDVKWDADKDESKRIKFVGDLTYKNSMDVNARLEHVNPFTSVLSSYNHIVDINTQGHFDIFVGGKEEIALDLNLKNKDEGKAGTLRMQTPVTGLVQMNYDLMSTTKQYQNSMDITWQKSNKIGILVNLDKPFNANKFHGTVTVKTPFKGFQMSSVEVDHEYNGKVKSMLKTELNNEKVKVDINYNNEYQDVNGVISVKSSLSSLRTASVSFHHKTTDNKYQNALAMEHNGKVYQYEGQMNHRFTKGGLKNKGKIVFNLPNNRYDANWDHSITSNELISKMQSYINGKSYELDVNGRQAITLSEGGVSFNLKIKSPLMDDILLRVDHQHSPSLIDSSATVSINSNAMMSGHVDYKREAGKVISKQSFKMSDIAFETSIISEYARFPMSGQINMKLNDNEIDASGTFDRQLNSQNGKLKFRSPFTKPIVLSIDRAIDGEQIISSSIEYGKTEIIAMENRFRWDNTKIVKISVVTPIESVRKFETLLKFDGGITAFKTVASLEIEPTFRPIQMTSEWNSVNGLNGKIRLETPFQQIHYSQISLVSKPTSRMTSSDLVIEYLPRREIIMKSSYMVQKDHFEGSLDIKTPFHDMQTMSASVKHNFRKMDIKTPVKGHELMRWVYRHGTDQVLSVFSNYECSTGIQITGDIKLSPRSINMDVRTPFQSIRSLSLKGNLERQNMIYSLDTSFEMNKKSVKLSGLVDLESRPMTTRIELKTPFNGLESSEINLSCTGDIKDLRATVEVVTPLIKPINSEVHIRYDSILDMETTAIITTGFKSFERLSVSLVNKKYRNEYQTHVETSWNREKTISFDASCDVSEISSGKHIKTSMSISTPFEALKTITFNMGHTYSTGNYMQSVFLEYNGKPLLDIDTSYSNIEHHTVSIVTRHPRPMNFRIGGHMEAEKINSDISLNWNTDKTDSNMNMEVFYSHSNNKCNLALRFVHPSKTIGFRGELKRSTSHNLISLDVNIDDANVFGYTYDCKHGNDDRDTSMKFRFPNRSIMFTNAIQNRLGSKMVTGAFFWDADGDQTKKVSVKGDITPSENGVDANVVLEMPSIGQDVKLDSNVKFNKGSVLFDGKTAFQYSKDSRKTLILSSRLEDLSSGTDTNYSFNLGIKHPYTTVDVEVTSLLESSVYKKMGSVDVKYQTANKMAKNFGIMGEIDSLKKSIKMDLTTPIKSINIQGNVQTTAPYKVSIKNLYDNAKPVSADIVFDPSDASIDVNMNYDIDNPQNILHVNAKMSDESGITAEVFRDVDSKRVSDTLINLKLKTSKILHTRVHWNPDLLKTVKSVGLNKIHKYGNGINKALQTSWIAVEQEVQSKHRLIISAIKEDMKPYINFMSARVTELQKMRRNNDYYLNDIVGHFQTTQTVIRHQMKSLQYEINSLTKDMDWTLYNLYLAEITELVKVYLFL
ncbi:uncharacterized protein LOC143066849 [Mytilus galloprovincialis]|uniref:uncharacterized protein LOC143066849 n=1 Tax=Mytilus galloprovincialis TaxID=29158 RepID=UPI003F7BDA0E